jgi:pyruvate, water dikinase
MSLVRRFGDVGAADLELVGGKGANLGELVRAGMNVPPGFVLTTSAYRAALATLDLSWLAERDAAGLRSRSAAAREWIEAAALPEAVVEATLSAYRDLGSPTVAVRSSATAEDLPGASFAGQQDTYLNVTGGPAVLEAVRRCWASLWTDRAIAYRAELGIDHASVALAVVVQAMAPHEVSGVIFTVDPVSGARDHLRINAARGLGEQIVSGQVTPDEWLCARDGHILRFTPAPSPSRPPMFGSRGGSTVGRAPVRGCLTNGQVADLVRLALQAERHYGGSPQDIEWSFGNGRFFLLQARPVTALGTDRIGQGPALGNAGTPGAF